MRDKVDKVPRLLRRSPLLEALFEIRFTPTLQAAGDVLPGLLYATLKDEYPKVEPLPLGAVPRQIRDREANLVYLYSHRLSGPGGSVQIGDRAVCVSTTTYPGWKSYAGAVERVLKEVHSTGLISVLERFSFRYINLIEAKETDRQLSLLNAHLELGGGLLLERGLHLRAEFDKSLFTTVVQMAPNTLAKFAGSESRGLLIDLDTIRQSVPPEFLRSSTALLEEGHSVLKETFFSLLTPDGLNRLEPEW